jgi:hypothetical protein
MKTLAPTRRTYPALMKTLAPTRRPALAAAHLGHRALAHEERYGPQTLGHGTGRTHRPKEGQKRDREKTGDGPVGHVA